VQWAEIKALLLSAGKARLTGEPVTGIVSRSTAGPGAGGAGSVFFSTGGRRVRLTVDESGPVTIGHNGSGVAVLSLDGIILHGTLEPAPLHCPGQAYITVSEGCIYHCRYCEVPLHEGKRKTIQEIVGLIDDNIDDINAISITSGVLSDPEEEEEYVIRVIKALKKFNIPIGVSIYPTGRTAARLHELGVSEVKFNLEAATGRIFSIMCPGTDRELIMDELVQSVALFGKGKVFSNIITGLGETDEELESCVRELASKGIIPVLRPLSPSGELKGQQRPSASRLIRIFRMHTRVLREEGLDPAGALTMCSACTGCDLVPGRDDVI
jgi:biotin synthase-related radical SAM superfamily protein